MATAVEPTKSELSIKVPTILATKHFNSHVEETEAEVDEFSDAFATPKDENDPYNYNDYAPNFKAPDELDSQNSISFEENDKVDKLSSSPASSVYDDDSFSESADLTDHTATLDTLDKTIDIQNTESLQDNSFNTSFEKEKEKNDPSLTPLDNSNINSIKSENVIVNELSDNSINSTDNHVDVKLSEDKIDSIEDLKDEKIRNSSSYSTTSSEDEKNDYESSDFADSTASKSSSFSSISFHQSTNKKDVKNYEIVEDKNNENRMSVASLAENPELNDISLEDDSLNTEEASKEWGFSDWSFPKTPNSIRALSTLFTGRSSTASIISRNDESRMSVGSMSSTGSNYDLLLARLEKENQILQEDPKARRMSLQGIAEIRASFERVHSEAVESNLEDDIDWDFWGQIVSDYETVARTKPRELSKMIQKGIPQSLRGMIWQLMSKSKDSELETMYAQLLKETSPHEKMISRDLNRTFPKHEYFRDSDGIGQEGLFNVVKAYSLYDKEVGYCQGISFIVGPLLLQKMPDEEAFSVLVKMMKFYNLRGHFLPGMDGLQLRLFQFDHLVEEMLPKVHYHLRSQGINSSMYASQWFMTLFAYKFPLSLVFRIYDTIFMEGIESIFRFSIALLKKNEKKLIEMDFEPLLEYLKSGLFESYQVTATGVLAQLITDTQYKTNEFVKDAYNIRITPKKLQKYQQAYYAQQEAEKRRLMSEAEAIEKIKTNNYHLTNQVKHLEGNLQELNREHVELANELVNTKVELAKVKDDNEELQMTASDLRKTLQSKPIEIENKYKEQMDSLTQKNKALIERNNTLEDQLAGLEKMLIEMKMRYAESENEREILKRRLNDLKKALG
ncbi:rab-GTPase-TBC domain-containing protein [Gigaspora margarita]|uniref:Rab-GTPase-TBC domain-containing protein n=1 Tax=Gigaspora margarita TaxID=4874 RepID=A0A8H3WXD2_GIGMA|nr:rab-GTPase-TBC domain-containing protein [Gigaspora margarita]